IDWGDGKKSNLHAAATGAYTLSHTYTASAAGSQYTVAVTGTDGQGSTALLQLEALVPSGSQPIASSSSGGRFHTSWSVAALSGVAVVVTSFWFGEKRELLMLSHHAKPYL